LIHELFYDALLEKGRHDIFFIYCTKHIAEQKQVVDDYYFEQKLYDLMDKGCPKLKEFVNQQMTLTQRSAPYKASTHAMSAALTIINIILNSYFIPECLAEFIEDDLYRVQEALEQSLERLDQNKSESGEIGSRIELNVNSSESNTKRKGTVINVKNNEVNVRMDDSDTIWLKKEEVSDITPSASQQAQKVLETMKKIQKNRRKLETVYESSIKTFTAMLETFV